MAGINRDEQDPQKFHVDWQAVHAGLNPWKRSEKVIIDPYLVAKAVKEVMRMCPHRTATGSPLVWNDYAVFRKHFRREMHAAMVTNLARIGLLTERVRPRLTALGITLPAV